MQYIGQTERQLKTRIQEHLWYVRNEMIIKAAGEHFNSDGHFIHDMKVKVLEKVYKTDRATREIREKMYIQDFHTELEGINKYK